MKYKYLIAFLFTCACTPPMAGLAQVNIIVTIAGKDSAAYSGDNGPAINADLYAPEVIWLDKHGNIIIADAGNNRVRKITASTGIITTIAGTGTQGYNGDNRPATSAELYTPQALTLDTADNIYIADAGNFRVRKINAITGVITTIAGTGVSGYSGDNGPATNAEMQAPCGLCFDRLGNLYIADYLNIRVRKVAAGTGVITTFAGNGTMGYSGDHGPATAAQIWTIEEYADSLNNIYLADAGNNAIRRVDAATGIITTIAGNGTQGYAGDGGPAINAIISGPTGIYIDKQQNIFFADFGNGSIREIDALTGIINTVAGKGITGYSGDNGPATDATLQCTDVVLDSSGIMYIADYQNNVIRKVWPYYCTAPVASFTVTPLASSGTGYTDSFIYTGTPYLIDSIKWSFGNGSTDTVLNPVHTYNEKDTYRVCVTVYTYCGVDSSCNEITLAVGNVQMSKYANVQMWPNPVSDVLNVINGANSIFYVYDLIGSTILHKTIQSDKEIINVAQLPPGIYVVQIVNPATGQRTVRKIEKE